MDTEHWKERWKKNEIGFHESQPNRFLVEYLGHLSLEAGSRVFLPLCGKTLSIGWLLSQGFRVCGVELSETAVEQLFRELGMEPEIRDCGELRHFRAENIDIFVGDIFALTATRLGPVDAIYDRAALVALPKDSRRRYAAHLREISDMAPQLLICFEYDQKQMDGPPFSIVEGEIGSLYGDFYGAVKLASAEVAGGLKGKCAATESTWLLQRI